MTLLDNLYNFYTWLMNSLANTFTQVFSKVGTKCVILVKLFTTTNTVLYLFLYSNFVMKSAIICAYGFSRTVFVRVVNNKLNFIFLLGFYLYFLYFGLRQ